MFLSEAVVLGAAEGKLVMGPLNGVDPGIAGIEPVDPELRSLEIAGEDRRAQPELRIVGALEGFVEVLDPGDRQQRPEGLLPPDPGVPGDVGHDRRLEKEAAVEWRTAQALAAGHQPSPAVERILQLLFD